MLSVISRTPRIAGAEQGVEHPKTMTQPLQPWFGRTFNFPYPAELLPNLKSRLQGTPARLEELVRNCVESTLTTTGDGKWTPQEHAGHLLDLEPLWYARLEDLFNAHQLTAADPTNRITSEAGHNSKSIQEILAGFRAARFCLLMNARQLDVATSTRELLHPRLKMPMRAIDHLYFVAEHDDHHLAHIERLVG